jgi:hypothetical protein
MTEIIEADWTLPAGARPIRQVSRRTLSGDPGRDLDWKGYYLLTDERLT